jgi:glycosyltransferase involved in cell wall biosynthesis
VQPKSVYVAFEVFPRPKGASAHIAAMVTALARKHAPVLLLCLGYADMPSLQLEGDIIIRRHKVYLPNMLKRAREFGDFVHDELESLAAAPEICVFRDPWSGLPCIAALPDSALIFEVNGLPSMELAYTHAAAARNSALMAKVDDCELFCFEKCHTIIAVSDVTGTALVDRGVDPRKIAVIPNSADDAFFKIPRKEPCVSGLEGRRWFGYVGSLHPWQGVDVLIDAWAEIAEDFPDVGMLIVHGGHRERLKAVRKRVQRRGIGDRVLIHGPVPPHQMPGLLRQMEFTCAPLSETNRNTVQGCCPIKIVESMAAGTPVLASNLVVTRSLIRHGIDGYLVQPGHVRSWAYAIDQMLSDADLRRELSAAARKVAEERFTRERMFHQLDALFASVTATKAASNARCGLSKGDIHA